MPLETAADETGDEDKDKAAADAAMAQAELEGRARRMGWRPKDEFRGDPARWTDARSFIDRGETELPVLRERYRALDDRFASLENRSAETERTLTDRLREMTSTFQEFRNFAQRADERGYARAKAELEAKMAAAVETADRSAYATARAEMDALERDRVPPKAAEPPPVKSPPETKKDETPKLHPDAVTWVADNAWFNSDEAMRNYAIAVHGRLTKEKPGLSMRENLAEVREDVMTRFPEKFGNKKREEPPATLGGAGGEAPPRKKGKFPEYNEWPADAKNAYARFAKMMPGYTKEEYAKTYFTEAT